MSAAHVITVVKRRH